MRVKEGLVFESLADGGCLIVDEAAGTSHALRPEAAAVWISIRDGAEQPATIAERTALDPDTVRRALAELTACELIATTSVAARRDVLAKAAAITGAVAGLELIESIATPTPAAAQSSVDTITPN